MFLSRHPASTRGAYRDRHGRWKRDAVDEKMLKALARRRRHLLGRPSRMVLSPRRWGQACEAIFARRRWLTSPVHRGEYGAAVNTIAQGMPAVPAEPVVTAACFPCCRRAMGAARIRHSLRPSSSEGNKRCATRAFRAAGMRSHIPSAVMPASRLRQGFDEACGLGARRSFSGGGKRGIQHSRGVSVERSRLWNTGSPGQAGAMTPNLLFDRWVGWVERSETHRYPGNEDGWFRFAQTHPTASAQAAGQRLI